MNLYLLKQTVNRGYDTFDSMIIAAENQKEAISTHPEAFWNMLEGKSWNGKAEKNGAWCDIKDVECILIATKCIYTKKTIVCASFNAG